jgi:hypothetical protein
VFRSLTRAPNAAQGLVPLARHNPVGVAGCLIVVHPGQPLRVRGNPGLRIAAPLGLRIHLK